MEIRACSRSHFMRGHGPLVLWRGRDRQQFPSDPRHGGIETVHAVRVEYDAHRHGRHGYRTDDVGRVGHGCCHLHRHWDSMLSERDLVERDGCGNMHCQGEEGGVGQLERDDERGKDLHVRCRLGRLGPLRLARAALSVSNTTLTGTSIALTTSVGRERGKRWGQSGKGLRSPPREAHTHAERYSWRAARTISLWVL